MVQEHGSEAVAAIIQGRLVGNQITEGGIMVTVEGAEAGEG
jgi:hypothetical protein